LSLAAALAGDLAAFRSKVPSTAGDSLADWRERPHDDLVLAVALAAWEGERTLPWSGMPLALGHGGPWAAWGWA
jgi:hypothetical protein